MKRSEIAKLRLRDDHCWDCGAEHDLVPHHRANRGAGGYKVLDTLQNCILVCAIYNGLMESDADVASEARRQGHKISKFSSPAQACFDKPANKWYALDDKGGKVETEPPSFLI